MVIDSVRRQHLLPHQYQNEINEESISSCVVERMRGRNDTDVLTTTCHAGTIVRLRANQTLAIATIDGYYKPMVMSEHMTYWGLYKID